MCEFTLDSPKEMVKFAATRMLLHEIYIDSTLQHPYFLFLYKLKPAT